MSSSHCIYTVYLLHERNDDDPVDQLFADDNWKN